MKKNEIYYGDYAQLCREADRLNLDLYNQYEVQRGLRDKNGNGVLTGLTNISRIDSFKMVDGVKTPCEGKLWYRGYDCIELVNGFREKRYGFEEVAYLLLFGELPNAEELDTFRNVLASERTLPTNFTRDVIMKAPSSDIMNSMTRSVSSFCCSILQASTPARISPPTKAENPGNTTQGISPIRVQVSSRCPALKGACPNSRGSHPINR